MGYNENKLKKLYFKEKTKGWDSLTKDEFMYHVEQDFKNWFEGYNYAITEMSNKKLKQ